MFINLYFFLGNHEHMYSLLLYILQAALRIGIHHKSKCPWAYGYLFYYLWFQVSDEYVGI